MLISGANSIDKECRRRYIVLYLQPFPGACMFMFSCRHVIFKPCPMTSGCSVKVGYRLTFTSTIYALRLRLLSFDIQYSPDLGGNALEIIRTRCGAWKLRMTYGTTQMTSLLKPQTDCSHFVPPSNIRESWCTILA